MKRYIVLLVLIVFTIASCAQEKEPAKEKIRLQWKWEKGKTYRYKITQEMKQKMTMPQGDMETSTSQVAVYSQKVTEVDDKGVATIEFKYESIKTEMDNPMLGKTTFDSTNEEDMKKAKDDPQLAAYAGMVGKTFIIKMSKDGEVVEVKGYSKLMEELLKTLEGNPMVEQLKNAFSDESMKKILQQSYARLPKEEIAIGDSWEVSEKVPFLELMNIKATAKSKNTYKGNETIGSRECARIDTQMEVNFLTDPEKIFEPEWESTSLIGTLYFDSQEGIMVKQEAKVKMKGTFPKIWKDQKEEKIAQEMTMKMELVE